MHKLLLLLDINLLITLATIILGGGILAGIAAFRKVKPEIARITVEVAGQAVIVQKGVIDSLQQELLRQATELRTLEIENEKCQTENREFKRTIDSLQTQLNRHSVRIEKIEEKQS